MLSFAFTRESGCAARSATRRSHAPDAMKIAYVDYERAPWDQGVLWTCYVGDLLLGGEIP